MSKVRHRQLYRLGPFGGYVNSTLCRRVRNGQDYNVAEEGESVTCHYCQRIIAEKGEPDQTQYKIDMAVEHALLNASRESV